MSHRLLKIWIVLGAIVIINSCSTDSPESSITLSGTFDGTTEDNLAINLTLTKSDRGFYGHGTLDGIPIMLSLLSSYRGLGQVTYDGRTVPVSVDLSFDGKDLTLTGLERPALLQRNGPAVATTTGSFSGGFECGGTTGFVGEIDLTQNENLLAGTGIVYSQTFALSGIADNDTNFKGKALFSDGSQADISLEMSNADRAITLSGILGRFECTRL